MPFDRTGSEPFEFDPDKLGQVKPTLAEAEGYTLSADDLKDIFGIQPKLFGKLPKRMVIPALEGRFYTERWYAVRGYLYVVEPEAWVPQVHHRQTMPVSAFKTTYDKQQDTVTETKFEAGAEAEVSFAAGGSYYGITVEAKASTKVSFNYSTSTTTKESLNTHGVQGDEPVHQLLVYPTLRCKVIKKQHINYTINDDSTELKWTEDCHKPGYWDAHRVEDKRVDDIRACQFHPVPMKGNGLGGKAYMLPVPEITASGELDVTTLMSRQGWADWYLYDFSSWDTPGGHISLASPKNEVAFQPMTTWTTIPPIKPTT